MKKEIGRSILKAAFCTLVASTAFAQTKDGGIYQSGLPNNALTEDEAAAGYQLLWNGKDYTGWGINDNNCRSCPPGDNWAIVTTKGLESGDTHKSLNPDSNMLETAKAGPSIFTLDSTWRDFDWKMEWQAVVGTAGNSGMLYHFRIDAGTDNNLSAPEYQISNKEWSEWTDLTTATGCNYDMLPLLAYAKNTDNSPSWVRAEGHWNQSRVISFGTRTAHYGNGIRLLEYQMFSAIWQAAYDKSKYKPKQGATGVYGKLHAGSFFIQDHGQAHMKFRNVRAKRLSSTQNPWGPTSPYLNKAAAAKGDSTLIDTLPFSTALFLTPTKVNNPNMIAPRIGAKVSVDGNGLYVLFSQPGNYSVTLEDARGITYESHRVQGSQYFLPGRFSNHPRFLTIYNRGEKIHESLIGTK